MSFMRSPEAAYSAKPIGRNRYRVTELIRQASSEEDYRAVAQLVAEYVAWMRARYAQDDWFVTEVLDKQSLRSELDSLPTMYAGTSGRVFLAFHDGEARGCGAYRRLDPETCEMKRVFVPQRFQGAGLGRRLCETLIACACSDGYRVMKLDTGNLMTEAITMYRSLGFTDCAAYGGYPEKLLPYFVFMQRPLLSGPGA